MFEIHDRVPNRVSQKGTFDQRTFRYISCIPKRVSIEATGHTFVDTRLRYMTEIHDQDTRSYT